MQYKKIAASVIAGISVLGLASVALAQDTGVSSSPSTSAQMEVQIGPKGNVNLRGTVGAVGATSITVKSWGGDWTVNVSSATKVTPHATSTSSTDDLSLVKVGDAVNVQGTVNSGTAWTIDAKNVHDGAVRPEMRKDGKDKEKVMKRPEIDKSGKVKTDKKNKPIKGEKGKFEGKVGAQPNNQ